MKVATFALLLCVTLVNAQEYQPSFKTTCSTGRTIFLSVEDKTGSGSPETVQTETLDECSKLCTDNECVGFNYNGQSKDCETFSAVSLESQTGSIFYQRSCVDSKKILVGFAREVLAISDFEKCLKACLDSLVNYDFECESVMFYPDDSECILNTEDRRDRRDLFTDESRDTVIYMDNICAGSQCYAPSVTQYIRVVSNELEGGKDSRYTVEGVTLNNCEQLCTSRIGGTEEDFSCKSFLYNEADSTCYLSDDRAKPLGEKNLVSSDTDDYYEKKCFAAPVICRGAPAFERVQQKILVGFAAFVLESVSSVTKCLDHCISELNIFRFTPSGA